MLSVLTAIATRPRQPWLVRLCALAALFVGLSEPALAQCTTSGFTLTCSGAFNSNINLSGGPTQPLSILLNPGVSVTSPGGRAVNAANTTGPSSSVAGVSITANNASVNDTFSSSGNNNIGLTIQSSGDATITASGPIAVTGTATDWGIWAIVENSAPGTSGTAMVTYGQPGAPGAGLFIGNALARGGIESGGIQADNRGTGDAIINATGDITGFVGAGLSSFYGLIAHSGDAEASGVSNPGNAAISYHGGTINITGDFARGILAWSDGDGSATATTDPGTKIILNSTNQGSAGVYAFASDAMAANGRVVMANVASEIMNFGPANPSLSSKPYGIRAENYGDAPISVTYTGPGITTQGMNGVGIGASGFGGGSVGVSSSGPIATNGIGAFGILAQSAGGPIAVTTSTASGQGTITTQGPESHGIFASSTTGSVQVTATNVSTTGEFSTAINATSPGPAAAAKLPTVAKPPNVDTLSVPVISGLSTARAPSGNVTVNVPSGGSIMGGWQATPFSLSNPTAPGTVGPLYGLPAAGVILSSAGGAATLINDGSIGALSDLAIVGDPQVTNNGTITGFTQFTGGNNSIVNNGTFNLRDFEATTGSGVRDTVRVAVANLGSGPNNTFTNNGTLALPQVTGATTLRSGGQYLPVANTSLGNFSNAMALNGPLQGQILGVSTFINSGVIDLQSNPAAGDVLVISGTSSTVNPLSGAASFPGTFISNGGSLKLDTVLNQGGAATISDTLVVDGTSVGANGATRMFVRNAGGGGAFTEGDGILVVEVLDQARSAAGVFTLANDVEAGPFDYRLFLGGVGGSNPGDWFLRNVFVTPPITDVSPTPLPPDPFPTTPPPNPLPPNATFPIIGPRLATYGVVQPLARQLGLDILGTLHERAGDTYEPDCVASAPAAETSTVDLPTKKPAALPTKKPGPAPCPLFSPSAWARFFGGTFNDRYQAFADPRADGNFWGFQGGVDLLRGSLIAGHYDRAGLFGAYANSNANVDGLVTNLAASAYILTQTGSVNLDAWSGGAYWTHVGPGGWYLDTVLQGTSYSGHASTSVSSLPTDGWGFLASLEGGYPIPLWFWPRLVLEPQGQILWQHVGFGQEFDGIGEIGLRSTSGWTGRLGLLAQSTIVTNGGQVWQPYVRANLWQDWGAQAATSFAGGTIAVPLDEGATRLEFAGGGTVKVNANWSGFAQAGYQFAVAPSNVRRSGFTGDIGLRYTW